MVIALLGGWILYSEIITCDPTEVGDRGDGVLPFVISAMFGL
jgi:hypothetical protein